VYAPHQRRTIQRYFNAISAQAAAVLLYQDHNRHYYVRSIAGNVTAMSFVPPKGVLFIAVSSVTAAHAICPYMVFYHPKGYFYQSIIFKPSGALQARYKQRQELC